MELTALIHSHLIEVVRGDAGGNMLRNNGAGGNQQKSEIKPGRDRPRVRFGSHYQKFCCRHRIQVSTDVATGFESRFLPRVPLKVCSHILLKATYRR